MFVFELNHLSEMADAASSIGLQEGRDFSFCCRIGGKLLRATCRHIPRPGRPVLGDIIPASRYEVRHA